MSGDCEMAKAYEVCRPKARKQHKCYECGGAIQIGEVYVKHSGIWDRPETYKVCVDCEALRKEIEKTENRDWDDPVPYGMVCESAFESGDLKLINAFIEIMRRRGLEIKPWMMDLASKLTAKLEERKGYGWDI